MTPGAPMATPTMLAWSEMRSRKRMRVTLSVRESGGGDDFDEVRGEGLDAAVDGVEVRGLL